MNADSGNAASRSRAGLRSRPFYGGRAVVEEFGHEASLQELLILLHLLDLY